MIQDDPIHFFGVGIGGKGALVGKAGQGMVGCDLGKEILQIDGPAVEILFAFFGGDQVFEFMDETIFLSHFEKYRYDDIGGFFLFGGVFEGADEMHFHWIGDAIDEVFGRRMEMQLPGGAGLPFDDAGTAFAKVQLDRVPKVFGLGDGCIERDAYIVVIIVHGAGCQYVDGRLGPPDTFFRHGVVLFFRWVHPTGDAQGDEQ